MSTRHRAHPALYIDNQPVCSCGRRIILKTVRSRLAPFAPIRNKFGMANWRASHGPVVDPERWARWQAR